MKEKTRKEKQTCRPESYHPRKWTLPLGARNSDTKNDETSPLRFVSFRDTRRLTAKLLIDSVCRHEGWRDRAGQLACLPIFTAYLRGQPVLSGYRLLFPACKLVHPCSRPPFVRRILAISLLASFQSLRLHLFFHLVALDSFPFESFSYRACNWESRYVGHRCFSDETFESPSFSLVSRM